MAWQHEVYGNFCLANLFYDDDSVNEYDVCVVSTHVNKIFMRQLNK